MVFLENIRKKAVIFWSWFILLSLYSVIIVNSSIIKNTQTEIINYMEEAETRCILHSGVRPYYVRELKRGRFQNFRGNETKDFVLCLMEDLGMMTAHGVFILDVIASRDEAHLRDLSMDAVNECIPKKYAEPREMAWSYLICYQNIKTIIKRDFFHDNHVYEVIDRKKPEPTLRSNISSVQSTRASYLPDGHKRDPDDALDDISLEVMD